jgi:uncharacterized membrane protein YedE/YeeE
MPLTFVLSLSDIAYTLAVGFVLGVAVSTILYLHLGSIRITKFRTYETPCPDRYK